MGYWGKHMKAESFRSIKEFQKVLFNKTSYISCTKTINDGMYSTRLMATACTVFYMSDC